MRTTTRVLNPHLAKLLETPAPDAPDPPRPPPARFNLPSIISSLPSLLAAILSSFLAPPLMPLLVSAAPLLPSPPSLPPSPPLPLLSIHPLRSLISTLTTSLFPLLHTALRSLTIHTSHILSSSIPSTQRVDSVACRSASSAPLLYPTAIRRTALFSLSLRVHSVLSAPLPRKNSALPSISEIRAALSAATLLFLSYCSAPPPSPSIACVRSLVAAQVAELRLLLAPRPADAGLVERLGSALAGRDGGELLALAEEIEERARGMEIEEGSGGEGGERGGAGEEGEGTESVRDGEEGGGEEGGGEAQVLEASTGVAAVEASDPPRPLETLVFSAQASSKACGKERAALPPRSFKKETRESQARRVAGRNGMLPDLRAALGRRREELESRGFSVVEVVGGGDEDEVEVGEGEGTGEGMEGEEDVRRLVFGVGGSGRDFFAELQTRAGASRDAVEVIE